MIVNLYFSMRAKDNWDKMCETGIHKTQTETLVHKESPNNQTLRLQTMKVMEKTKIMLITNGAKTGSGIMVCLRPIKGYAGRLLFILDRTQTETGMVLNAQRSAIIIRIGAKVTGEILWFLRLIHRAATITIMRVDAIERNMTVWARDLLVLIRPPVKHMVEYG